YLEGRAEISGFHAMGAEIRVENDTGVAAVYQTSGFSGFNSLWLTAGGTAISAEAIGIGGVSGQAFIVGTACKSGSVTTNCYRDDSSAPVSFAIGVGTSHTFAVSPCVINVGCASFSTGMYEAPNSVPALMATNAANTADVEIARVDG